MSAADVLEQLRALGRAEVRNTWARYGEAAGPETMFGVRFADLEVLAKRHRGDHALACELWASENVDARLLAVKIADPEQMSGAELDRWLGQLRWYMGVDVFVSSLVARSKHAQQKAAAWAKVRDELRGRGGWMLIAQLAADHSIPDEWFSARIDEIAAGIHSAPNRKREAMNSALIAIGGYRESLRERALAAADRIGKVDVDHGDTYCKTPDARSYIESMVARAQRRKQPAAKKSAAAKKPAAKKAPANKSRAKKSSRRAK